VQDEQSQDQKTRLAAAIARGKSVTAWARKNNVPWRTALDWASEPEVRRLVESWRLRQLERAAEQLAAGAPAAIAVLARLGYSESAERARAQRASRTGWKSDAEFARFEKRLAALEARFRAGASGGRRDETPRE
jgi:hypothetical protein